MYAIRSYYESEPGAGSCFSIELSLPRAARVHPAQLKPLHFSGVRVLVVDDNTTSSYNFV